MTRWSDACVVASDHALHTFDGRQLAPLEPRLRRTPNPFQVQGFGGALLYCDYKQGIHRYDGTDWTPVPIPPELEPSPLALARDFSSSAMFLPASSRDQVTRPDRDLP